MTLLSVADERQSRIERLSLTVSAVALALWRQRMMRSGRLSDLIAQWLAVEPLIERQVAISQLAAATGADDFLDAAAEAQGERPGSSLAVVPAAISGVGSNGFPLRDLIDNAVVSAGAYLMAGRPTAAAWTAGEVDLLLNVETQVADAGRAAEQVAMTARSWPKGYVRMIEPGACSRCVILAGKFYKRNTGFDRHPRCRCVHVPKAEDSPDDVRTDPQAYFDKLSKAEQDRVFSAAGAEAIRRGADMSQVVNARLGMSTATVGGQQVQITRQGTSKRSYMAAVRKELASARGESRVRKQPRLMPESILRIAGDDAALARRLMINNGYIVGNVAALAREATR